MKPEIENILRQLTLEEKASLCSGADKWTTKAIERLGIPSAMMSDGPHGIRGGAGVPKDRKRATCFPSGSALASSWNTELLHEVGCALGSECNAQNISILLGPAANIKRSPLCGRNFEYFSEDPYLSSRLAAAYIEGVQSQGVGTALKHFSANNKETDRMTTDTMIDERTLREIYLASFEYAVRRAKPVTMMCAYNKMNGTFCSENQWLLTEVLREEWGFEGSVMSDWGAVNHLDDGIRAGLDIEMPGSFGVGAKRIASAVRKGKLSMEELDRSAGHVISTVFQLDAMHRRAKKTSFTAESHHALARSVAGQCMVLLKNDGVLPLKKSGRIAVIGDFAVHQRYQGCGSSHIEPTMLDVPLDEIKKAAPDAEFVYCSGYREDSGDTPDEALIREAVAAAKEADAAVIFAGLPERFESEAYDRLHMRMPESHNALIRAVSEVQKNVCVVLYNGSPVEMPWAPDTGAILEGYLGGQASGGATADILFGKVNPSGKLAETFPVQLSDNPSFLNFPGEKENLVEYREGVFVGYRYYEKKNLKPLFPFGHGLSYTEFRYDKIETDQQEMHEDDTLTVTVALTNAGCCDGAEIVQLYVRDCESSVMRPVKELKGFRKVFLKKGESASASFQLSKRAFAYFDDHTKGWVVEDGKFEILVGGSSADTPLSAFVTVHPVKKSVRHYTRQTHAIEIWENPTLKPLMQELFRKHGIDEAGAYKWVCEMPLRNLFLFGDGVTEDEIDSFIEKLNAK